MEEYETKTTKQLPNRKVYLLFQASLCLAIVVCIVVPLFHHYYIYPSFTKELVNITENEAMRLAVHMKRLLIKDDQKQNITITDEDKAAFEIIADDFSLMKIKVFSPDGTILYSTDKNDIGRINDKSYFTEIVAKGKTHTLVVRKNTTTLEDEISPHDVVETYVPVVHQGQFIGAFELYYNITERKEALDKLNTTIKSLIFALSFLLIITFSLAFIKVTKMLSERLQLEEKLEFLANTDALTKIANRRHFLEDLNFEISRFIRYSHPATLLLFDIDHFKKVNDTYGHQVGDDVLRTVAKTCKDMLRENDLIGRYGGEEFIVCLPETDAEQALKVAEKMRRAIEELQLQHKNDYFSITISIGVAPLLMNDTISEASIISHADQALFQAKSNGRNQVVLYQAAI